MTQRWITRPLLIKPDLLSSEEEAYFMPYIFNIHEEETVKRIKKALGPNSLICLDGGSVSNKWGMWNLYTDVKCYLYPQLKAG